VICFFERAVYEVELVGAMMKQIICQRTTYSLVKEDEHGGNLAPLFCESVSIFDPDFRTTCDSWELSQFERYGAFFILSALP
jgi:hypothetical protein